MQSIIDKYAAICETKDISIIKMWQEECRLRQELRQAETCQDKVLIRNSSELEFILRSLYYSERKEEFFCIVFENMHKLDVLNYFLNTSKNIVEEFLNFIADYIVKNKPAPKDLQFLINIYQDLYHDKFSAIAAVLDCDSCDYLLDRTASKGLRRILKTRQIQLRDEKEQEHYGLLTKHSAIDTAYDGIYGDKISLFKLAVKRINNMHSYQKLKYNHEAFKPALEAAESLFQAGLHGNCLSLLSLLYNQTQQQYPELLADQENSSYKKFSTMLNKLIPCFALLHQTANPDLFARQLYKEIFPSFAPEKKSIYFLNLYRTITAGLHNDNFVFMEIRQSILNLNCFQDDIVISTLRKMMQEDNINLSELKELSNSRKVSSPYESFLILELLRLIQKESGVPLSSDMAGEILGDYLRLYFWTASPLFINSELLQQIEPMLDYDQRKEMERTTSAIITASNKSLIDDFKSRPELYYQENDRLKLQLMLSRFTGV